jgi:Nif-specific regulatory protein
MASILEKILRRNDRKTGFAGEPATTDVRRLEAALEISRDISAILESGTLLERILDRAVELTGARRGFVLLCTDQDVAANVDGPLHVEVARNLDDRDLEGRDFAFCSSVVRETLRTRQAVVVTNAPEDPRFLKSDSVIAFNLLSILCVPMQVADRLVGLLYLDNPLVAHQFTEADLSLLEVFASQAAVAIRNAQAFRRIASLNEQLEHKIGEVETLKERLSRDNITLKDEIERTHHFAEVVGSSPAIREVLRLVERVAPTDSTTLLLGETGTGKELIARAIHKASGRTGRPLVTVNCAALPVGLLESELFGHEKGSFTGAYARKLGRFELADGGTIFLDEIGDISEALQTKLLRVLQEGEFERVGGVRTLKVNVRVIAATNRELERAVQEGRFREDLYYRLNVLPIHIPPLRQRREDVLPLVRHFIHLLNGKLGKSIDTIPRAVADALTAYDWPGNVRELMNVIERSMILSEGNVLELGTSLSPKTDPVCTTGGGVVVRPYEIAVKDFKRELIVEAIRLCDGNKAAAARTLRIQPTYLSRLIRQFELKA